MAERVALAVALKRNCAIEGESTAQFMAELKKLTIEDKEWFADRFKKELDLEVTFTRN